MLVILPSPAYPAIPGNPTSSPMPQVRASAVSCLCDAAMTNGGAGTQGVPLVGDQVLKAVGDRLRDRAPLVRRWVQGRGEEGEAGVGGGTWVGTGGRGEVYHGTQHRSGCKLLWSAFVLHSAVFFVLYLYCVFLLRLNCIVLHSLAGAEFMPTCSMGGIFLNLN